MLFWVLFFFLRIYSIFMNEVQEFLEPVIFFIYLINSLPSFSILQKGDSLLRFYVFFFFLKVNKSSKMIAYLHEGSMQVHDP